MRIYPGHIVIYKKTGQRAIIRKTNKHTYIIEFIEKYGLINIMEVSSGEVEKIEDNFERCPVCGDRFTCTKSPVLDKVWYDCRKCGKTKEEIKN